MPNKGQRKRKGSPNRKKSTSTKQAKPPAPRGIRSKDKKVPDHVNFPMDEKALDPKVIKVSHVYSSDNANDEITIFTPKEPMMRAVVEGVNVLFDIDLSDKDGNLRFAMQGAGASSKEADTRNFSMYTRGLKEVPPVADFATRIGKEIRLKKVTLYTPGCRTGRHKDDLKSHLEDTGRFLFAYTTGKGACLSFDSFKDDDLKRSGLSLTYFGNLQLHKHHWRKEVDANTVVIIFDVPLADCATFPQKFFDTLKGLGKEAKEAKEESKKPKIFNSMSNTLTVDRAIVAVYCFQLTRYYGLSLQDYHAIFKDGTPTLEEFEKKCREMAETAYKFPDDDAFKCDDNEDDEDDDEDDEDDDEDAVPAPSAKQVEDHFAKLEGGKIKQLKRRMTELTSNGMETDSQVQKLSKAAIACMKSTGVAGLVTVWTNMLYEHKENARQFIDTYNKENSGGLTREKVLKLKAEVKDRYKSAFYSVVLWLLKNGKGAQIGAKVASKEFQLDAAREEAADAEDDGERERLNNLVKELEKELKELKEKKEQQWQNRINAMIGAKVASKKLQLDAARKKAADAEDDGERELFYLVEKLEKELEELKEKQEQQRKNRSKGQIYCTCSVGCKPDKSAAKSKKSIEKRTKTRRKKLATELAAKVDKIPEGTIANVRDLSFNDPVSENLLESFKVVMACLIHRSVHPGLGVTISYKNKKSMMISILTSSDANNFRNQYLARFQAGDTPFGKGMSIKHHEAVTVINNVGDLEKELGKIENMPTDERTKEPPGGTNTRGERSAKRSRRG
ncbi:hypothetical protein TrCOL_g5556 [Triparma columacea]|uniref:Uncharacterized protein n=1 Tax=Triparma columacea TaxID=722753 RepID=A0A9W7LGS8_9STRA|nr:hypothetical protein TrCOL_g5556 [Triparma columacea]